MRFEERDDPRITKPTDAIISMSATCICGSDLWPYRGANPVTEPTPMGHEYCSVVEEVGSAVASVRPGQFVPKLIELVLNGKIDPERCST